VRPTQRHPPDLFDGANPAIVLASEQQKQLIQLLAEILSGIVFAAPNHRSSEGPHNQPAPPGADLGAEQVDD